MNKSVLLSIFRGFARRKVFTIINMAGLSVGLASCIAIFLFIEYELSFDTFHNNHENIYRVTHLIKMPNEDHHRAATQYPLADALREDIAGAGEVVRVIHQNPVIKVNNELFETEDAVFTEPEFFNIFSCKWIYGDKKRALENSNTCIITDKSALKYFGELNVFGKTLSIGDSLDFKITGVVEAPPKNTHIPYTILFSTKGLNKRIAGFNYDTWNGTSTGFYTYVKLHKDETAANFESKMEIVKKKYLSQSWHDKEFYYLQPIKNIHFDTRLENDTPGYITSKRILWIFALVGLFIIAIASINFINLATAMAMKRAKEVGIKKVIGASRKVLIKQFLTETTITVAIAGMISILVAEMFLPYINQVFGNDISLSIYNSKNVVVFFILLIASTIILTGIYPSFVLSSFNPLAIFSKHHLKKGKSRFSMRSVLVIVQFTISIILITATVVVFCQVRFIQNKDLGFDKNNIICIELPEENQSKQALIKDRLLKNPDIKDFSFCLSSPTGQLLSRGFFSIQKDNNDTEYITDMKTVDENFARMYGIQLLAGRWFRPDENADSVNQIIVNEEFVKNIGIETPDKAIGERISIWNINPEIIGVTESFHTRSLEESTPPLLMYFSSKRFFELNIKVQEGKNAVVKAFLDDLWIELFPGSLPSSVYLNDFIKEQYESETQLFAIIRVFAVIAIAIASLGVLGLISFIIATSTKEIGIRKVLGAKITQIVLLLSKEFARLIIIAMVIATPIAWIAMKNWLQNYAFHIELSWWMFFVSSLFAFLICFVTIFFHTFKAANMNPIESLRDE